jgi:hypothetical protein
MVASHISESSHVWYCMTQSTKGKGGSNNGMHTHTPTEPGWNQEDCSLQTDDTLPRHLSEAGCFIVVKLLLPVDRWMYYRFGP